MTLGFFKLLNVLRSDVLHEEPVLSLLHLSFDDVCSIFLMLSGIFDVSSEPIVIFIYTDIFIVFTRSNDQSLNN